MMNAYAADRMMERKRFIAKIIFMVLLQTICTGIFVVLFIFDEARIFMLTHTQLMVAAVMVFGITLLMTSFSDFARTLLGKMVLLPLLTLSLSYMTAGVCNDDYNLEAVLVAFFETIVIVSAIILGCTLTKVNLMSWDELAEIISTWGIIFCLILVGLTTLSSQVPGLHRIYGIFGSSAVSLCLFVDILRTIGDRGIELSPDEFSYANSHVYVHIIWLFRFLLMCYTPVMTTHSSLND